MPTLYVLASTRPRNGRTMLAGTLRNGLRRVIAFEERACAELAVLPDFPRDTLEVRTVDLATLGAEVGATRLAVDVCDTEPGGETRVVHGVIATMAGEPGARFAHVRDKLERDFALSEWFHEAE